MSFKRDNPTPPTTETPTFEFEVEWTMKRRVLVRGPDWLTAEAMLNDPKVIRESAFCANPTVIFEDAEHVATRVKRKGMIRNRARPLQPVATENPEDAA